MLGLSTWPVAFEPDCREGICGSCGFLIDGVAHGGRRGTTVCQLSMRFFQDGDSLTLEPWRARAFPVLRDLIVDRSAFDRIIQAGGFISVPVGSAPDGNATLIEREAVDTAFDAAACIGCGACVAACPNAAAMLFTSAKLTRLNALPQGQPQRYQRTLDMVDAMQRELFGSCTNHGECEAVCPKEIPMEFIGLMNRLHSGDPSPPPRAASGHQRRKAAVPRSRGNGSSPPPQVRKGRCREDASSGSRAAFEEPHAYAFSKPGPSSETDPTDFTGSPACV